MISSFRYYMKKEILYIDLTVVPYCFKSSEHINEKGDGPYHGFGYSSILSDPLQSKRITVILQSIQRLVSIQMNVGYGYKCSIRYLLNDRHRHVYTFDFRSAQNVKMPVYIPICSYMAQFGSLGIGVHFPTLIFTPTSAIGSNMLTIAL